MNIVKNEREENIKTSKMEKQNAQVEEKIRNFELIITLLEIKLKHYETVSKLKFLPMFIRANFRLKYFAILNEILSKKHFIEIYTERINNVSYAENVLQPMI